MQAVQPDIFALIEAPPSGGLAPGETSAAGFDFAAIFSSLAGSLEIGLEDRAAERAACAPVALTFPVLPLPDGPLTAPESAGASSPQGEGTGSTGPKEMTGTNAAGEGAGGFANSRLSPEIPAAVEPGFPAAVVRVADLLALGGGPVLEFGSGTEPAETTDTGGNTVSPFPSGENATDGKPPARMSVFPLFSGLGVRSPESPGTTEQSTGSPARTSNPENSPVRVTPPAELSETANTSHSDRSTVLRFAPDGSNPTSIPGIPPNAEQSGVSDRGVPFRHGEFTLQAGSSEGAPNPAALLKQATEADGGTATVRHTPPATPEIEQGVMDQTVRAARFLLSRDGGSVRLVLDPPELGVIRVHLEVSGNRARTWIETESAGTRDLLLETVPRLRRSLEHQSIHLESVSVRSDGGRHAGGFSHSGASSSDGGGREGSAAPAPLGDMGDISTGENSAEPEGQVGETTRLAPGPNGWDLLA